jgi:hypothetical protein
MIDGPNIHIYCTPILCHSSISDTCPSIRSNMNVEMTIDSMFSRNSVEACSRGIACPF